MKALPRANFSNIPQHICTAAIALALAFMSCGVIFAATSSDVEEVQLGRDVSKLPAQVQRMRQAILKAATSGDIEELRVPIDMNELRPIFAKDYAPDPIAYLKSVSADGNGAKCSPSSTTC